LGQWWPYLAALLLLLLFLLLWFLLKRRGKCRCGRSLVEREGIRVCPECSLERDDCKCESE
jgi:hypothetical protein